MIIKELLQITTSLLKEKNIKNPRLDAEVLLSYIINQSKEYLVIHNDHEVTKKEQTKYLKLIKKRAKHIPTAYLTGTKEFYSLDFLVNKNVLIPRPETELIIDSVVEQLKNKKEKKNITIIDLGTGSGCIITTLTKLLKKQLANSTKYFAIDISRKALQVAKKNAKLHNIDKDIAFLKGNLLKPIIKRKKILQETNELIITANLPYLDGDWKNLIKNNESASLKYEPELALIAGHDGLKYYKELEKQIKDIINTYPKIKITIYCEIDNAQKQGMEKLFQNYKVNTIKDLANKNRLIIITN